MQTVGTFTAYDYNDMSMSHSMLSVDNMPLIRTDFQAAQEKLKNRNRQQRWRDKLKENPGEHGEFKSTERVRAAAYVAKQRREMSETDKLVRREDERLRKAAYRRKKSEEQMDTPRQIDINEPKVTTSEERIMERANVDKVPF